MHALRELAWKVIHPNEPTTFREQPFQTRFLSTPIRKQQSDWLISFPSHIQPTFATGFGAFQLNRLAIFEDAFGIDIEKDTVPRNVLEGTGGKYVAGVSNEVLLMGFVEPYSSKEDWAS